MVDDEFMMSEGVGHVPGMEDGGSDHAGHRWRGMLEVSIETCAVSLTSVFCYLCGLVYVYVGRSRDGGEAGFLPSFRDLIPPISPFILSRVGHIYSRWTLDFSKPEANILLILFERSRLAAT